MDPDATWRIITGADSTPDERSGAALDLLVWLAKGGSMGEVGRDTFATIRACEAVILSDLVTLSRLTT